MEDHKNISHHSVSNPQNISKLVNNVRFHSLSELGSHTVEVQSNRAVTKLNVPVQIGFFVLEYGKLLLLRFYYDFIVKYMKPDYYCLIQADTDSLYMGLACSTIHQIFKTELRDHYIKDYENWIARE